MPFVASLPQETSCNKEAGGGGQRLPLRLPDGEEVSLVMDTVGNVTSHPF
jgi:hypothetical protein